ncbi:MAG: hypothetical protein JNJ65_15490 [Cyclobacteriaceae bacterium]|nr:hypothetical protein [Cyclobacteriaceae bacterium]
MKTRIAIITGIFSLSLLSFAFSTLESQGSNKTTIEHSNAKAIEPAGGFAVEEIKR